MQGPPRWCVNAGRAKKATARVYRGEAGLRTVSDFLCKALTARVGCS
jgi:hypothetical protein